MVSIIIPVYNSRKYINQCLKSCLSQTYKDYEIVVIDDCSDDDISYCAEEYGVKYIRNNENLGPAASRNIGIKNSSGEYISFLDADDIMSPYKLEKSIAEFKKDPELGMTCGNYQILSNRTTILDQFYTVPVEINHTNLLKQNFVASGSVTVKRSVLDDIGLFNEEYWIAEDYDLWLRISEKYKIKYIHETLYYYSIIRNGNSLTQRDDIQINHIENINKIKRDSLLRVLNDSDK